MSIENIIVRMPNWVGDLVMAQPILADLREKFPSASITAMCCTPLCTLIEMDPAIDELFCFHKKKSSFLPKEETRDILGKIQKGKFDLGVLLTNSFSSAWWFFQGGVKRRVGFSGNFRTLLITDKVNRVEKKHHVELYKELLKPLGIFPSTTKPCLYVSDEEVKKAKELLAKRGYPFDKKLVGISPFAAYGPAKQWPLKRFIELSKKLEKDACVVLFSNEKVDFDGSAINLSGQTSLRELMALISLCDSFVTNDSGPMHIASALNVPLVALFGSTDENLTGPLNGDVINKKVHCSPCFKRECPIDFRCMMRISCDEVYRKVMNQIDV